MVNTAKSTLIVWVRNGAENKSSAKGKKREKKDELQWWCT